MRKGKVRDAEAAKLRLVQAMKRFKSKHGSLVCVL